MDRFVCIGEVVKAIGLRGEVKLYPLLDFYEPLLDSDYLVWRDGSPASIRSHRQAGSCYALKCADVNDRSAAEGMTGKELGFMRSSYLAEDFDRPDGGLPFRYLGREVHTADGHVIGTVEEVRLGGALYLLVVPGESGEILIPSVEPILRFDDELEGPLVIDPPEGLLDVQPG